MKIDIGGTPEFLMLDNTLRIAKLNGCNPDDLVAILDPFDLSRAQRKLELGDYKIKSIKFPVEVPGGAVDMSSDKVKPPKSEEILPLLEAAEQAVIGKLQSTRKNMDINQVKERYSYFKKKLLALSNQTADLRDFMNCLVNLLSPALRIIRLEDILSGNIEIVYEILNRVDIPARAICPSCSRFTELWLKSRYSNCSRCSNPISSEDIIKSGRYIPQAGFFAVITYLCGYRTFSNSEEKTEQARKIMQEIGIIGEPILTYQEPKTRQTMFESYLFGGEETLINNESLTKLIKEEQK